MTFDFRPWTASSLTRPSFTGISRALHEKSTVQCYFVNDQPVSQRNRHSHTRSPHVWQLELHFREGAASSAPSPVQGIFHVASALPICCVRAIGSRSHYSSRCAATVWRAGSSPAPTSPAMNDDGQASCGAGIRQGRGGQGQALPLHRPRWTTALAGRVVERGRQSGGAGGRRGPPLHGLFFLDV